MSENEATTQVSAETLRHIQKGFERVLTFHQDHEEWLKRLDKELRDRRFPGVNATPTPDESRRIRELTGEWFRGLILVKTQRANVGEVYDALGFAAELRAAMQEDTPSEGGFTVPAPIQAEILRLAGVVGVARQIGRVVPMKSKTLGVPRVATEPSVGIVAEEGAISQSEPVFGSDTLTAKKVAAFGVASLETLEDSIVQLGDWLLSLFAEKTAGKVDQQAFEGDGTGTNWTGLVAASGTGSVTNGANGGAPSLDKLAEVLFSTLPQSAQVNASWVMHPKVWYQLNKLKDSQNGYLLTPDRAAAAPLSLYSRPVYLTDQLLTNRTVGTSTDCSNVYCGDFKKGLFLGDRSMHLDLDPFGLFTTAQIRIRFIQRAAVLVALPSAFVVHSGVRTTV